MLPHFYEFKIKRYIDDILALNDKEFLKLRRNYLTYYIQRIFLPFYGVHTLDTCMSRLARLACVCGRVLDFNDRLVNY